MPQRYNTTQRINVKYANGAGGKFLISCLFLFDQVAHWDRSVQSGDLSYWQWYQTQWAEDNKKWILVEPWLPWNLIFYSRRLSRNNDLTTAEYNQLVEENASEYFRDCWKQNLKIVDHWHKRDVPEFLRDSIWLEILINQEGLDTYKHLVKNKVWLWDDATHTVTSMHDHPDWINNKFHGKDQEFRSAFNNKYAMTEFQSYDEFFTEYLLKQSYVNPFVADTPDPNCVFSIQLADLIKKDNFIDHMQVLENFFNQKLDHDLLSCAHTLWAKRSGLI